MTQRRTPLTIALIVANFAAFAWEYVSGALSGTAESSTRAMIADGALVPPLVTQNHEWWRIVTAAFLHANVIHIVVNMISLWVLGRFIESIMGSAKMAIVYIASMVISGLAVAYFSAPDSLTVGASGAIFGLFGALFAIGLKLGQPGMQLIRANIGILLINLIFTFTATFVSRWGHVGGLIGGFLITLLIYYPPVPIRTTVVDTNTGAELESEVQAPDRPPL